MSEAPVTEPAPESEPTAPPLTDLLRDSGLVSSAMFKDIEASVSEEETSIVIAMAEHAEVQEEQLAMLVAHHMELPFAHLLPGRVYPDVFTYMSLPKWMAIRALPVEHEDGLVTIASADPHLLGDTEQILKRHGLSMQVVVAPLAEIDAELERLAGPAETSVHVEESTLLNTAATRIAEMLMREDGPGCVEILLGVAVSMSASDIHLGWEADCLVARLRKDGNLRPLRIAATLGMVQRVISAFKVLASLDIANRRHPQDGRARVEVTIADSEISVLVRIATFPCRTGEKLAVRVLESGKMMELESLGLPRGALQSVRDALRHPNGLFLVTGPTGSGKTTTLYAALNHLSREDVSLFTIEDPIEFEFPGAYQSQVNEMANVSFAELLKALVRQDPDVVLLGEIRDIDSAETALQAAHSGRILLSSLHANSASTAVTRLIDMNIEPFVLGSCIRAIIGQRLVRKLCACKRPVYRMPERHVRIKEGLDIIGSSLFEPVGCQSCLFTGFRGRVAVFEVLTLDQDLADLVMAQATSSELLKEAVRKGFRVMAFDGFTKAFNGITTIGEVERQVGPAVGIG